MVKKNVQDSRLRIWQDAAQERFGSFTELNQWLLAKCRTLWQELHHPEYGDVTVADARTRATQPDAHGYAVRWPCGDDGQDLPDPLVSFDRNRYSAPCELVGQMVSIHVYPERVHFVAHDAVVAIHVRRFERDKTLYDWQHYLPLIERKPGALRNGTPFADLPAPLLRLRSLLLKREGGDRLMARILTAAPKAGLESVLMAVELVLESCNPCPEHIENVLHRCKAAPPPDPVETDLTVTEAPVADTGRYDRLRLEASHA